MQQEKVRRGETSLGSGSSLPLASTDAFQRSEPAFCKCQLLLACPSLDLALAPARRVFSRVFFRVEKRYGESRRGMQRAPAIVVLLQSFGDTGGFADIE